MVAHRRQDQCRDGSARALVNPSIALVTHTLSKGDGQGRVNYEIVRRAAVRGYRMTLFATTCAPELRDLPGVSWVPVPHNNIPTQYLRQQIFAQRAGNMLRRRRHEFDLLHVNGAIVLEPSDLNSVHFVHGAWLRSSSHPWQSKCHKRNARALYHRMLTALNGAREKVAFARARHIVAVSTRVRAELLALGVPSHKVEVVANGVDLTEFQPGEEGRASLGLPDGVPLALFAGDLATPRKNFGLHLARDDEG